MPTASAPPGGWAPYNSIADPHVRAGARTSSKIDLDPLRRPPPGIATAKQKARPRTATEVWRPLTWEEHLSALRTYVAREKNADVPLEHEERGVRLGVWLSAQWAAFQSDRRGGYLSAARKQRLEAAGVNFGGQPPPAAGPNLQMHLNERKWDSGRGAALAAHAWRPREFDTSKPACEPAWRPYSAVTDPHLKALRERQRRRGLRHYEPQPEEAEYIPYGHPPVKGVGMSLALKLKQAKEEWEQTRAAAVGKQKPSR